MKKASWNPFRFRTIVGGALVLGIVAGIYLGDLFKGFGWGPGSGSGFIKISKTPGNTHGDTDDSSTNSAKSEGSADLVGHHKQPTTSDGAEPVPSGVVKVLIDDRNYFVRRGTQREPITLEALVTLIEQTRPNEDGLRAVIDRTATSRVSVEVKLFDALKRAGISENAIYLTPQAVE